MMRLLALPVAVPEPTSAERAVLRLALRGLYPPAIAARLGLDEGEVDAMLRRLARLYLEVGHATTNRVDDGGTGDRVECSRGGYGHGTALAESLLRADNEARVLIPQSKK